MRKTSKVVLIGCTALLIVLLVAVMYQDVLYWNNSDIDLNSGKKRKNYHIWIFPVKQEVVDTSFSVLTAKYANSAGLPAQWYHDVRSHATLTSFVHEGGRALAACDRFATTIELADMSEELNRQYTQKALTYLQAKQFREMASLAAELEIQIKN